MNKKEALDRLFGEMYSLNVGGTALDEDAPAEEIVLESTVEKIKENDNTETTVFKEQNDDTIEEEVLSNEVENEIIENTIIEETEEVVEDAPQIPCLAENTDIEFVETNTDSTEEVNTTEVSDSTEEIEGVSKLDITETSAEDIFKETEEEKLETSFINNIIEETKGGKDDFDRLIEDQQIEMGFKTSYSDDAIDTSLSSEQEEIIREFKEYEESHTDTEDTVEETIETNEIQDNTETPTEEVQDEVEENTIEKKIEETVNEEVKTKELSEEDKKVQRTNTFLNVAIGVLSAIALFLSYKAFLM